MSPTTKYWMFKARAGFITGIGLIAVLWLFSMGKPEMAGVAGILTFLLAVVAHVRVDRRRAHGLGHGG